MLSVKYYFYSPQYIYNYFVDNGRYSRANMPQKDKFKNSKLMKTLCLSFNTISPVQFIYHELRYT